MPAPAAAVAHSAIMDPWDRVQYINKFDDLLEPGAKIESVESIVLYPEAAALGFRILDTGELAPAIVNDKFIRIYCEVAPEMRTHAAFDAGVQMPVEFTIVTDDDPFLRFQRTMTIPVKQL